MADFAPEQKESNPSDFTRASRGFQDDSVGTLLTGLGDTLKMGVKAIDDGYKRLIKDDLRQQVDDIQDTQGGRHDMPTLRAETPDEIQRMANRMRTYKQAMLMGNAKESTYWGALDASARQLRARYPGYRDHIDDVMKEFTGQNPANALLRELRQETAAAASKVDSEAKRQQAFIDKAAFEGTLPPDWRERDFAGIHASVADENRKKWQIDSKKSTLALGRDQKAFDTDELVSVARGDWGTQVQATMRNSGGVFAKSSAEIEKIRQAVTARGGNLTPTPEETTKITALAEAQISELNKTYTSFLTTPREFLGNDPYTKRLTGAQIKDMRDSTDAIIADIRSSISGKDLGFAGRAARLASTLSDTAKSDALGNDYLRRMYGLRNTIGETGMSVYLSQTPGALTELQTNLKEVAIAKMATKDDPDSFITVLKDMKQHTNKPEVVQNIIRTSVGMISNPDLPVEVRRNMVEKMYGQGNEAFLSLVGRDKDPRAGHRVFQMMANPAVAKQLAATAKETGDPEIWNKYERWTTAQVYALNTLDINTIASAQHNAPGINIKFDPRTMSFSASATPLPSAGANSPSPGVAALRGIANDFEEGRFAALEETVKRVNASFAPLRDIADYHKHDRDQYALSVLASMATRAESKYGRQAVSQSIISKMVDVVGEAVGRKSPEQVRKARADIDRALAERDREPGGSSDQLGNTALDYWLKRGITNWLK